MDRWNRKYTKELERLKEEIVKDRKMQEDSERRYTEMQKHLRDGLAKMSKKLDKIDQNTDVLAKELGAECSSLNEMMRMVLLNFFMTSIDEEIQKGTGRPY